MIRSSWNHNAGLMMLRRLVVVVDICLLLGVAFETCTNPGWPA